MHKKGNLIIGAVAVVLALVILGIFLVSIAQRECQSNRDCPGNAYCNTQYECVEFPQQVVVKESNFLVSALILGMAILIAAYIFKGGRIPWNVEVKKK
tara:strand:- start:148 stop:441 length:294 start_codon:yes stop_codon:yes gene_type:complete